MNIQPFFGEFPSLELGEIVLREIRESDALDYYNYMNDQRMDGFLTRENRPASEEKALEELKYWKGLFINKRSMYWCIALKDSDQMIGTAGFNNIIFNHDRAEISYDLDPEYWGMGMMMKSIKAILKYADFVLAIRRVQATVIIDNERSIKLLERCNFLKEGILKNYEIVDGEHKNYFMYARVA